jgi:hypothetical protein
MTHTFYFQTDVTSSRSSLLQKADVNDILQKLKSHEMDITISDIRKVKNISPDSANFLKRKLPYFLGAKFTGDVRNSKNFEYITHFVIDIDHYGDIRKIEDLKKKLSKDARLMLAFVSPSGDGLKLVYALKQKITSLKEYSDFYKSFSIALAKQFEIEKYLDFKTSDATRICFLSFDNQTYFNPSCELVDAQTFISDFDLFNKKDVIETSNNTANNSKQKSSITDSQYKDILSKLNPKTPKKEKQYIVPEVLYSVSEEVKKELEKNGMSVEKISDINYGRKFTVKNKNDFAVFNIYYGKRGFSVVKTPARNSNEQLLDVCVAICEYVLFAEKENKFTIPKYVNDATKKEDFSHTTDRFDEEKKTGRIIKLKATS